MAIPLMPKATAVWLIENTTLTFKQIGDFCGMHELEVKGIADGDVAQGIIGVDPILNGQLTKEMIEQCQTDPNKKLELDKKAAEYIALKSKQKKRYTPIARRQDKPDAIFWLLKNCPSIPDKDIIKLIGTTKNTVSAIREKEHWNMKNIKPRDPVLLGLCTQIELDSIIEKYGASL